MRQLSVMSLLAVLLLPLAGWAQEAGVTAVQTDLKKTPFLDGETLAALPAKTALSVQKRQGAWMQVKTADGKQGWVRMLSVRLGDGSAKPSGGSVGGTLAGLNRSLSGEGVATTGVRGLSEEDLKRSRPNPEEVARMDKFDVSAAEAKKFARAGGLKPQQLDYLPAPAGLSSGSSASGSGNSKSSWGE